MQIPSDYAHHGVHCWLLHHTPSRLPQMRRRNEANGPAAATFHLKFSVQIIHLFLRLLIRDVAFVMRCKMKLDDGCRRLCVSVSEVVAVLQSGS
jgi:hypothetical protein